MDKTLLETTGLMRPKVNIRTLKSCVRRMMCTRSAALLVSAHHTLRFVPPAASDPLFRPLGLQNLHSAGSKALGGGCSTPSALALRWIMINEGR